MNCLARAGKDMELAARQADALGADVYDGPPRKPFLASLVLHEEERSALLSRSARDPNILADRERLCDEIGETLSLSFPPFVIERKKPIRVCGGRRDDPWLILLTSYWEPFRSLVGFNERKVSATIARGEV